MNIPFVVIPFTVNLSHSPTLILGETHKLLLTKLGTGVIAPLKLASSRKSTNGRSIAIVDCDSEDPFYGLTVVTI